MAIGKCLLTGNVGPLVKCHIIPQAFTRPTIQGEPLTQIYPGERPKVRWSSWYDQGIVTREGEDILSSLDDWAIRFLRKNRLVWSGFAPFTSMASGKSDWGIRKIAVDEPDRLLLFFHSLLWRAAVSSLDEMRDVSLSHQDLRRLRNELVSGVPRSSEFYAVSLTQLSTPGFPHNEGPSRGRKVIPGYGTHPEKQRDFFRFYLDGLIVHIDASPRGLKDLGPLVVGSAELVVSSVTFERSAQFDTLREFIADAAQQKAERRK